MCSFRRFCPDEAAFLSDRALKNCRLRIRFDGTAFPPKIVYRIYQAGAALYINSGEHWSNVRVSECRTVRLGLEHQDDARLCQEKST